MAAGGGGPSFIRAEETLESRLMLSDLITRLEAAPEGSAELDEAIARKVLTEYREERLVGSPVGIATYRYPDGTRGTALRFSRAADAAMTLIPAGAHASAHFDTPASDGRASVILIAERKLIGGALGATLALALCGAALQASARAA